jgi:fructose 1,6-bisphosphatase
MDGFKERGDVLKKEGKERERERERENEKEKTTISVIKADVGSIAGHYAVHPKQLETAEKFLSKAKEEGLILDYRVFNAGDDLELLITHRRGENNPEIHGLAWRTFLEVTNKVSKPLKLYAAGQDLLSDTFSGNVRGMGPGLAEMEIEERASEPFIVFAADKTERFLRNSGNPGTRGLELHALQNLRRSMEHRGAHHRS